MFAIRLSMMEPYIADRFYPRGVPDPSIGYFRPYNLDGPLVVYDYVNGEWVRARKEMFRPIDKTEPAYDILYRQQDNDENKEH